MRGLKAFQGLRLGSASIRSLDAPLPSVQAVPLSLSVVVLAVVVLPLRSPPFRTKAFTTTRKPCTHACTMVPPDRSAQVLKERRPLRCHAATPGMRMLFSPKEVFLATLGSPMIPLGHKSMVGKCRPVTLQQVWAGGGRCWRAAPEYFVSPLHLVELSGECLL